MPPFLDPIGALMPLALLWVLLLLALFVAYILVLAVFGRLQALYRRVARLLSRQQ